MTTLSSSFDFLAKTLLLFLLLIAVTTANLHELREGENQKQQGYNPHDESVSSTNHNIGQRIATDIPPITPRIIGGSKVSPGQFSWFGHMNGCGGSLIHPDIGLTAAHCSVIKQNTFIVGAYILGSLDGGAISKKIVDRVIHPLWNESTTVYDFMILKLNSAAPQTPVSLNKNPNYPADNQDLNVIGFGQTVAGNSSSVAKVLQQVKIPYVNLTTCKKRYNVYPKVQLCAGGQAKKDACQGDSGGPLFDNRGVQVGLVSSGKSCGKAGTPGLYSRVDGVQDWIHEQICKLSSTPPFSCKDKPVSVRIDIQYDSLASETSWAIRNATGAVFYYSSFGKGVNNKVITTYVLLNPGHYIFVMRDKGGNGICCSHGAGNFAVYISKFNRLRRVARSNGKFKSVIQRAFVVPAL